MSLEMMGWRSQHQQALEAFESEMGARLGAGRVVAHHRRGYAVEGEEGLVQASLPGKLRHRAESASELPCVGDWVALDESRRIVAILPRSSLIRRKSAGARVQVQTIAANVDFLFVVTSANQDFNPRRLQRYLALARQSDTQAIVVLNKVDLCPDVGPLLDRVRATCGSVPQEPVSFVAGVGRERLLRYVAGRHTIALVGSSGVGKSTLVNWLLERSDMEVGEVRAGDDHGRHTTTTRQLLPMVGGGALIDTPGMRELALWAEEDEEGSESDDEIHALMAACRFRDCQHEDQPGCAVQSALERGELSAERWRSYLKIQRELTHQREHRTAAARQRTKQWGREIARRNRQRAKGPGGSKFG